MIPQKYKGVIFSAVLSIFMGLLMSGIITAINTGFDADYIDRWLHAFVVVVPIAFFSLQLLKPLALKISSALTESDGKANE